MKVIKSIQEMLQHSAHLRAAKKSIAFVPTMGSLHEGHLSLMRIARQKADVLVVSIFVNPTQFGPEEDFETYPRNPELDQKLCAQEQADIIFYPDKSELYPVNFKTFITTTGLTEKLCGLSRPVHFRGVTTIVGKLFNIIQPHYAVFGQKDAQQALVIKRMVTDLNFDVEIIVGPIIRESDGLAMSSRNKYLNSPEREQATVLFKALELARQMTESGENRSDRIKSEMLTLIKTKNLVRLDYLEIVDSVHLESLEQIGDNTLIALAAFVGKTRLIDNILLTGGNNSIAQ